MNSLNLLVIEDDVDFALLVKSYLSAWGHRVTVAHNWLSVMMTLKNDAFDAIIADVETPTGNGLTAFKFLNAEESVKQTPKVFLTGLSDAESVRRCYEMGAEYIHKSPNVAQELKKFTEALMSKTAVDCV